ncbi:MAG: hypothetical protein OEU95_00045 [Nitrospirota bacterium]|nr:hypothetical protein [Nitrospirota bacterium]
MKRFSWEILLGIYLVALSAVFYFIHYMIFRDVHHIFIYLLGDIAFVPIEVLLVTMIIHRLLDEREKRSKLEKLNMVIETFFSETGTRTLAYFSVSDPGIGSIRKDLIITNDWSDRDFSNMHKRLKDQPPEVDIRRTDLEGLKNHLIEKRSFMLRLLENPVLLEHESFTDLLRALFHLTEELVNRKSTADLPASDLEHLSGDIKRAYGMLSHQWLDYMKYLKGNYPYLFSLAMRTNPFDREASPIVK